MKFLGRRIELGIAALALMKFALPLAAALAQPLVIEDMPHVAADAEPSPIETPSPSPTPSPYVDETNADGTVEPLGVWAERAPSPTPTPLPSVEPTPIENAATNEEGEESDTEDQDTDEVDYIDDDEAQHQALLEAAQEPRTINLNKKHRKRLLRARISRHRIMKAQRKALGLERVRVADPRGEGEIRFCTANLDNYSTKKEYRRVYKAAKLPQRLRIESSFLNAASTARCDVVGFQGLMAQNDEIAEAASDQLVKKLSKQLGGEWESRLGKAVTGSIRNGFFVRTDSIEVEQFVSYEDKAPTSFGAFDMTTIARPFIRMTLRVPGRGSAVPRSRRMLVFGYDFRSSESSSNEPEAHRMEMADLLRQIVHTELDHYPPDSAPVVVLLGDRRGPQMSPATQLLEGRYRLMDFTQNGKCKLEAESAASAEAENAEPSEESSEDEASEKSPSPKDDSKLRANCDPSLVHLKEFFGVSTEGIDIEPVRTVKKEETGEKTVLVYPPKKELRPKITGERMRHSEVYLAAADLSLALKEPATFGRYNAGTVRLRTDLKRSPLVWVELNW